MKDDLHGVFCTEFQSFSRSFTSFNGSLNEYRIYNLIDAPFNSFSRP
jgi:hypothetical protein